MKTIRVSSAGTFEVSAAQLRRARNDRRHYFSSCRRSESIKKLRRVFGPRQRWSSPPGDAATLSVAPYHGLLRRSAGRRDVANVLAGVHFAALVGECIERPLVDRAMLIFIVALMIVLDPAAGSRFIYTDS